MKKIGDKVTYTTLKSGKRKKKGTVIAVVGTGNDAKYELDSGAFVYDSDLTEARLAVSIMSDDEMKFVKKVAASKKYIDLDYSVLKDEVIFDGDQALLDKVKKEILGNKKFKISINESTDTGDIPDVPVKMGPAGTMPCGSPYFNCTDDQFWSLHTKARGNGQWFNKHYKDSDIADWARKNKGKNFYLKHESGMFRKVKAR